MKHITTYSLYENLDLSIIPNRIVEVSDSLMDIFDEYGISEITNTPKFNDKYWSYKVGGNVSFLFGYYIQITTGDMDAVVFHKLVNDINSIKEVIEGRIGKGIVISNTTPAYRVRKGEILIIIDED